MKLTDDILKEKFKVAFWNTFWAKLTLIGTVEVLLQSMVLFSQTEPNYIHLIFWTVYLIVVLIIRNEKEWTVKQ